MLESNQVQPVVSSVVTPVALEGYKIPLLNQFEGASAAYSLRRLKSWSDGENVVEVRRASDDTTRDFTAIEVSDGTMADWVNATVALPLDTASGAAAAYSLRDLSASRSDITSSGDTGGETTGALVAQVRRSSDDEIKSFTATEVAGDTLVDWVNGNQVHYESNFASNTNNWNLVTNSWSGGSASWSFNSADDVRLSVTTTGVSTDARRPALALITPSNILVGENYSIEVDYEVINGTPVLLGSNLDGTDYNHNETLSESGTSTISASPFNATTLFLYFDGDNNTFEVSITAIRFKSTVSDGHVTTWYDQSGNNNHAEQTTEARQPKIVDGGTLVADGLKFDGVDDYIDTPVIPNRETFSFFGTFKINVAKNYGNVFTNSVDPNLWEMWTTSSGSIGTRSSDSDFRLDSSGSGTSLQLVSLFVNTSQATLFNDGTLKDTDTTRSISATTPAQLALGGGNGNDSLDGTISEVIIYNSDQSDNRIPIESNMADYYGDIDLPPGFDSGNNEVDGYVATWYDQSGNGNDAVQNTATSQPKIVDAGVLVADGIKFDGVGDMLALSGTGLDIFKNVGYGQLFSVITPDITTTGSARYFEAMNGTDTGARFLFGDSQDYASSSRIGGRRLDSDGFQDIESPTSHGNNETLFTGFLNWADAEAYLYQNGTEVVSSSSFQTAGNTSDTLSTEIAIGGTQAGLLGQFKMLELIIYNSDQSAKRTDIEGNINDYYEIFADETYRRPDGSAIFRPDGTSVYERP